MKTKVEPKLKFEVGEKVVICGCLSSWPGHEYYPNRDEFLFTTVTEVLENGQVVVEGGYKYRQAYETRYDCTEVLDYFRIVESTKQVFYGKKYYKYASYTDAEVTEGENTFCSGMPTFLFKYTDKFLNKARQFEIENINRLKKEVEIQGQRDKEKPIHEEYKNEIIPIKQEFYQKLSDIWKKHYCSTCENNKDGHCSIWDKDIDSEVISECTAWK